jgi:hypothetical protein
LVRQRLITPGWTGVAIVARRPQIRLLAEIWLEGHRRVSRIRWRRWK